MKVWATKQRGIGFASIILLIAGLLFAVILALKLVPAYLHNMQIERIFKEIVNDPEMQSATVNDIRTAYSKRATMDYISVVTANDVEVNKDSGHLSLGANYSVKIPLAGNISLLLEFAPSAEK